MEISTSRIRLQTSTRYERMPIPARMASRMALYHSVRRVLTESGRSHRRRERPGSGLDTKDVAGSSHRVDQAPLPRSVDLPAEVADVDVHDVRFRIEVESPYVLRQHRSRLD